MYKELEQRFKELMQELENNIENKKDLEYIQNIFSNMFLSFLKDIEGVSNTNEEKLSKLEERIKDLGDKLGKIEKDLYINDGYEFEIVCPYCNCEFETEFDELKTEIKCPECNNIIELDWNEEYDENCVEECSGCHGTCFNDVDEEIENFEEENEDDM